VIALFASFALAGVPVVYDGGDPTAIVAAVAEKTGLPASQLTPVALDALLAAPPQVLGAASLRRCAREPVVPSAVQAELGRALAAWSANDEASAMDHLDLTLALAGCLSTIVDPAVLSQVFLLRGAVAVSRADPAAAKVELRSALALEPNAVWPPTWGPDGASLLAEVQADPTRFTLATIPPPAASGPWIDGAAAPAAISLAPGLHLAQYAGSSGIRSGWLTVGGNARLVIPGGYRRPVLAQMATAPGQSSVGALVEATLPDLQAAYVADGGGIWLITIDETGLSTTELVPLPPPPATIAPEPTRGKRH
jgi:hypothetical protein